MPDKTYKDKETGAVKTEKQLIAAGAKPADIEDMLKLGYIEDVTGTDVKKKEATPEPSLPASAESSQPSASTEPTSTPVSSSSGTAPGLDFAKIVSQKFESKPESKVDLPPIDYSIDYNKIASQPGESTKAGIVPNQQKIQMYEDAKRQFEIDNPRRQALEKKVKEEMLKPENKNAFFTVKKPALTDKPYPDSRYTFLNNEALDNLLASIDQVDGKKVTDEDKQNLRSKIISEVDQARDEYDVMEKAKANYASSNKGKAASQPFDPSKYETKLSPQDEKGFQSWLDMNYKAGRIQKGDYDYYQKHGYGYDYDFRAAYKAGESASINSTDQKFHWNDIGKKPNHSTFSDESKYNNVDGYVGGTWEGEKFIPPFQGIKDKYGNPSDPLTAIDQARIDAEQERTKMGEAQDNQLRNKTAELQSMVDSGKITSAQADSELNRYRIAMQGSLDQYISQRASDLAKKSLPDLYTSRINDLRQQQSKLDEGDVKYAMLEGQILDLQKKKDSGVYYSPEDDPAWVNAVTKAYKDNIIDKNERVKSMFDNQAFNVSLDRNAPARDLRVFASKQLQGILHGIGGVEQIAGGVLNMYGNYTLGNRLSDNGKSFAAENFIPMPMDKEGKQQVIDDSPGTWIASNIAAQIPNTAMLVAAAEAGGGAVEPILARMVAARALPFVRGAAGGLLSVVPESLFEAGDYYNQAISEGKSIKVAREGASNVLNTNLVLLGLTNPLEFGMMKFPTGNLVGKIAKGFTEANLNGIQEVLQNYTQNVQDDPTLQIMQYALSPEGQSTYLSGAAMGVLQNATVGSFENWRSAKETAGMFDFNSQYKNSGNLGLPPNSTIAKTIFGAFQMKDAPDRANELKKVVEKLEASGTYTDDDGDRVKALIDDVAAVKDQVPKYGTPEQRMAVFNELLQIHTNNKYREQSGIEDIANLQDERNAESTKRIKNIMLGKEPLYFINGFETDKDKLLEAVANKGLMKMNPSVSVVNDPETQQKIDEIINPKKAARDQANDKWAKGHPEQIATIPGEPVEYWDPRIKDDLSTAKAVVTETQDGNYQAFLNNGSNSGSSIKTVKDGRTVDYFDSKDDAMTAVEQYFKNPNPESIAKPLDEEFDKKYEPVADQLVKIESAINNRGYDLTDDYDAEVSLIDKKTKQMVDDPEALPDDVHELVGKYETALKKLDNVGGVNIGKLMQEARKRFFGEEAQATEVTSKSKNQNAIQEQTTGEKVLHPEKPGVELPQVGEGNAKPKEPTAAGKKESVAREDLLNEARGLVSEATVDKTIPDNLLKNLLEAAKNDPKKFEQHMKDIADQANDAKTEKSTKNTFTPGLTAIAQKLFPQEKTSKEESQQPKELSKTVSQINDELPVDSDSPDVQERSAKFEDNVRSEVEAIMRERGLNTSEEAVDNLHNKAMAEIYDPAGAERNADKSIAEVIDDIVPKQKKYQNPAAFKEGEIIQDKVHENNDLYEVVYHGGKGGVSKLQNVRTGGIENWNSHNNPVFEAATKQQVEKVKEDRNKQQPGSEVKQEAPSKKVSAANQKNEEAPKAPVPPQAQQKPAPAKEIKLGRSQKPYTLVGQNKRGENLYEDANGVRAKESAPGIFSNETVSIIPTKEGVQVQKQARENDFKTTEELAPAKPNAEQPAQPTEKEKLLKELADKKAKLRESLRDARGKLNMGVDPKVIADGIDLLATYTKLGIYEFKQIVKDLIDTFGKEFMDKENTEALKGVYAYYRQNLPREQRKSYSTEDQVDDFIDSGMNVDNLENPNLVSANGQDNANTTSQEPLGNDQGGLAGGVQSEIPSQNEPGGNTENVPGRNSDTGVGVEGTTPVTGKKRRRGESRSGGATPVTTTTGGGRSQARTGGQNEQQGEKQNQGNAVRNVEKPLPENPADRNHVIEPSDEIVPDGRVGKVTGNMDALLLLRNLESENRNATPEEKKQLAKFVGWGGLASYLDGSSSYYADKLIGAMMNGERFEEGYSYQKMDIENERIETFNKSFDQINKEVQRKFNELVKQYPRLASLMPEYKDNIPLDDVRKATIPHLLTENEYQAAKVSTDNAHYTERRVIDAVWRAAKQFGFTGGSVLESAAGIGHFFGLMPQDLARSSNLIGVELETITSRLLKKLYPEADIFQKGFQDVRLPNNSIDLAVTNVPFGDAGRLYDEKNKDITDFSLHNYFIAKNLRLLKPGGMAIMITSKSTMDNAISRKARQWFVAPEGGNSELIGAVRLPNNAFDANAGTQVTTDLMVFQKRKDNIVRNLNPFLDTTTIHSEMYDDAEGKPQVADITINDYYLDHPDNMIGNMKFAYQVGSGGLYGKYDATLHAEPGTNVVNELQERLAQMPENIFGTPENAIGKEEQVISYEKEGKMFNKGGTIYVSQGDVANKAEFKYKTHEESALQYIPVRDKLHDLIYAEQNPDSSDEEIETLRKELNQQYDKFVKKNGSIAENSYLYDHDIDYSLVASLEDVKQIMNVDEKGKVKKTLQVSKGTILKERVNFPRVEPTKAANIDDAVQISIAYRNHVSDEYIGKLLGMTPEDARAQMLKEGKVFENPLNSLLETPEDYLSGEVRKKLHQAEEAVKDEPKYQHNVEALKRVIPEDIPAYGIGFKMGVSWLPQKIYFEFTKEFMGVKTQFNYLDKSGNWVVNGQAGVNDSRNIDTYAAGHKSGIDIIDDIMNNRSTIITVTVSDGLGGKKTVRDDAATARAADIQQEIKDAFVKYVRANDEYKAILEHEYNERFNGLVEKKYNLPVFANYPGANKNIQLRTHQRKAVQRILGANTLLAHSVGTGKTFTMITAAMEMKRLGIAKKPMIAVQNATTAQFAYWFQKLYPGSRVLIPSEKEMEREGRRKLFGKIATGNWDAVILPHSQLDRLPDNPERVEQYIRERIEEIQEVLNQIDEKESYFVAKRLKKEIEGLEDDIIKIYGGNPDEVESDIEEGLSPEDQKVSALARKKIKKTGGKSKVKAEGEKIAKLRARIEKITSRQTDDILYFEDLGIDALMVDESHYYKKMGFQTGLQNIKGIDTKASKRALSLLMKVRSITEKTGGKNVVFSTGTPITNTMAEAWTNLRFLAPDMIKEMGVQYFDQFINTFAQVMPTLEQDAGGRFKVYDRLAQFNNLPELITTFRTIADVVTTDDIPEFKEDPENAPPSLEGGGIKPVLVPISPAVKGIMKEITAAYDAWKQSSGREKKERSWLPLVATGLAQKAAIDVRLVDPSQPDNPESKVNYAVANMLKDYKAYDQYKAAQFVFSDAIANTTGASARSIISMKGTGHFNLYEDIKKKLIAGGVPESQIALMTDSKYQNKQRKGELWEKVRQGTVRFVIGSTDKMGVGVDAAERMIAIHHIDAPPRPDQFEQRNGRIVRQGSIFTKLGIPVKVYAYGTEGTRDATAFDRLKIKQKFINQIMKADFDKSVRQSEDPFEEENLNADDFFAEMGANLSGSQTALKLVRNERDLRIEQQRAQNYKDKRVDLNFKQKALTDRIKRDQVRMQQYQLADETKKKYFDSDNTVKTVKIDDQEYSEKFAENIDSKIAEVSNKLLNSKDTRDETSFPIYVNGMTVGIKLSKDVFRNNFVKDNPLETHISMRYSAPDIELEEVPVQSGSGQGFMQKFRNDLDAIDRRTKIVGGDITEDQKRLANINNDLQKEYDFNKLRKLEQEHADLKDALISESALQEKADREARERVGKETPEDLDAKIEEAKADLRDEVGDQLSSGIPLNALPQLTKLAVLYIRKGIRTVSQFAKAIGTQLNKVVVAAWNAAKRHFEEGAKAGQAMGPSYAGIKKMFSPDSNGGGNASSAAQEQPETPKASSKKSSMQLLAEMREKAKQNAETMWKDLEKELFGSITLTDEDFKNRPTVLSRVSNVLNKIQDATAGAATKKVSEGVKSLAQKSLEAKNKWLRRLGKSINSVFANIGKNQEDILRSEKFAGESRVRSVNDAVKISQLLRNIIDNNPHSLSRINQVIDPEFYQELTYDQFKEAMKVDIPQEKYDSMSDENFKERYQQYRDQFGFDDPNYKALEYDDLTPEEEKVHDIIRSLYDAMHEINFAIGKLTPDTYEKNKGNYSARLYDYFEIPKEAEAAFSNNMVKLDESLYKQRGDLTEWKLLHRLADPVYAVSKRIYQTLANKAIIDYADYVNKTKKTAVSKTEQPGYRRLGWGYGSLSNKWVRDDIAEDFIGYFYADAMMQKFYDFVKGYDRMPLRQFFKKLYTVYNPGVHVGNISGNNVFGAMIGVNPIRLNSNLGWAKKQADDYSAEYRYMLSNGLLNTDFTAQDLSGAISTIEQKLTEAIDQGGTLTDIKNKVERFYSATDDVYKMAAFKSLLDLGYKPKEALDRVKEGFQNYRRVGKAYDLFSKVPIVGQPFGKFAGDLARITKNTITTHPLNGAAFLFFLKMMSNLFSYLSGETDEEKKIRESRMGSAKIPLPDWLGGDVPLAWKIGGSEWNVARFLSPLFLYGSANNDDSFQFFQKLSPQPIEIPGWTNNPSGAGAVFAAKNANDPVFAPLIQLLANSDFRGAPIFDPKENKYRATTLTAKERGVNALRFLSRSYVPYYPVGEDFINAVAGSQDYYGRDRAWWQVISNFIAGPKIVKFPDTRYGEILEQKMDGYGYRYAQEQRVIKQLTDEAAKGEISQETFEKRSAPHLEEMSSIVEEANEEYKRLTGKVGSVNLKDREVLKGAQGREGQLAPQVDIPKVNIDVPKIEQ